MSMRWYLPATLWAAVLLGIGSLANVHGPESTLPLDKVAHLLMYGTLGVLAGFGWRRAREPSPVLVIALALLVGMIDELNQSRIPGRSAEVADWIMDAVGIVGGFAIARRTIRSPREEQGQ